jgi:hypothetical protein
LFSVGLFGTTRDASTEADKVLTSINYGAVPPLV